MVRGLVTVFPACIRPRLQSINWDGLEEIRVRIGWPVELIYPNRNEWLGNYDSFIDRQKLDEMMNYITGYSLFSLEEELKQGYITFSGGHRIGITGHATYEEQQGSNDKRITNLVDIGGLNIRIAHERKGCGKEIASKLRKDDSIYNTVIFASPGVGKTTYLRDLIRIFSNGDGAFHGKKICVVDERSEIAACKEGRPQNDLGKRTDVLDGCPKLLGMEMVLRSMAPDIIAVDELGKKEEFGMLEQMRYSGVKILGSIHAGDVQEVMKNPRMRECLQSGAIERLVELRRQKDGSRGFRIYDGNGVRL